MIWPEIMFLLLVSVAKIIDVVIQKLKSTKDFTTRDIITRTLPGVIVKVVVVKE